MLLSTLTLPAPARFPYAEHRSMAEVMAAEQITVDAVQNYVAEATIVGDSCYGKTAPRDACNAPREPDHNRLDTGGD